MGEMTKEERLVELYDLIDEIETCLMTTRRADGMLVTRPMATQQRGPFADLWFVTDIESLKISEIVADPNVSIGYYNPSSKEWVSVSGVASLIQDRNKIHELYSTDWRIWFGDEGGVRDGGPDDPRLALIFVEALSVTYMKNRFSKPRMLFEIARSLVTGERAELGREEHLTKGE